LTSVTAVRTKHIFKCGHRWTALGTHRTRNSS